MPPAERRPPRPYRSVQREEQARRTRQRVLEAATALFLARGYAGTTMRAVATAAGVSVPTVELLFGTKARVLTAAIDVAIAGDDEPVPMLDRPWAGQARRAGDPGAVLELVVAVVADSQERAAGLLLAAFEGGATDGELAGVTERLVVQRHVTAGWIVDTLAATAPLRPDLDREDAVETVWLLMDPAVFDRLTRHRGWTAERYRRWLATSLGRLLLPDDLPSTRLEENPP